MNTKIYVSLMLLIFCIQPIEAKDTYRLYGDSILGSKFKPIEVKSPLPFDKNFNDFSERQKKMYRLAYGLMDNQTPALPEGGSQTIYTTLIEGHDRVSRGGWLRFLVTVNEEGDAVEVAIYDSPSKQMSELALTVFFNTKFIPATCAGEHCQMDYQFEFKLRSRAKHIKTLHKEDFG